MKYFGKIYMGVVFALMFLPIIVMIVFSFNATNSTSIFGGFSFMWYEEMVYDSMAMEALKNTIVLALSTTAVATVLGTVAALGIYRIRRKWLKTAMLTVTNIPMMNPEIVMGVSLMFLFAFVGNLLGLVETLGFWTMLISHVTFCLPYVVLNVLPKLTQLDPHLVEAAQDLGSTPVQAFFKVTLPSIASGITSGALMAFTLSLDDFVISHYTSGGFTTLPVYIYTMTKKRVTPEAYAIFTCIFLLALVLLVVKNLMQLKADMRKQKDFK